MLDDFIPFKKIFRQSLNFRWFVSHAFFHREHMFYTHYVRKYSMRWTYNCSFIPFTDSAIAEQTLLPYKTHTRTRSYALKRWCQRVLNVVCAEVKIKFNLQNLFEMEAANR